jgi:hypothetical protein
MTPVEFAWFALDRVGFALIAYAVYCWVHTTEPYAPVGAEPSYFHAYLRRYKARRRSGLQ